MNLIQGKVMNAKDSLGELSRLPEYILRTLKRPPLERESVINACDALSKHLCEDVHLPLLTALGLPEYKARRELELVKLMTSREYLVQRVERELSRTESELFTPYGCERPVRRLWRPLGVLMHIAAGNVDALPAYSVIEGLLMGNINILKLPGADDGLSIAIFRELIELEPKLSDYIYVFNLPSTDAEAIVQLSRPANAIVVWGGDEAVRAVRSLAEPDTRVIEWGHKLSFAYVSGDPTDEELWGLAYNICDTDQLFCNSCQGVFLDTDDSGTLCAFARRFLAVLERCCAAMPKAPDPYLAAQKTLELYTEELEQKQVYYAQGCSVTVYGDSQLTPSHMFRNPWVRPLPREKLVSELYIYKNRLQSAGLLCPERDRPELAEQLMRCGIVRICSGERMSLQYCGIAHDGEFPLRRYANIVSEEF